MASAKTCQKNKLPKRSTSMTLAATTSKTNIEIFAFKVLRQILQNVKDRLTGLPSSQVGLQRILSDDPLVARGKARWSRLAEGGEEKENG